MMSRRPKAINNALVSEIDDEVLVFDVATNRAVNLNSTAAAVWSLCDGRTDVDGLTEKIGQRFGKPASRELIELAIVELDEHGLLSDTPPRDSKSGAMSRRTLIRGAALTSAIAVPMIAAIATPAAAVSASCEPVGSPLNCPGIGINCREVATTPVTTICDTSVCCSGVCASNREDGLGNCTT